MNAEKQRPKDEIELRPDGWKRFEQAVDAATHRKSKPDEAAPPKPKPTVTKQRSHR